MTHYITAMSVTTHYATNFACICGQAWWYVTATDAEKIWEHHIRNNK